MTQFRFRGSEAFAAVLHRPPSQFGVPELPGVVGAHGSADRAAANSKKSMLTRRHQCDIIMMSSKSSGDIERITMLWYNSPEAMRVIAEASYGWDDDHRRRSMLRLIGRTADNRRRG
jgi:hypothetical protein